MARVYMCDRCGDIFDPNNLQEIKIGDRSFKKMKPVMGPLPRLDDPDARPMVYNDEFYWDLCNSCLRDFQRWWAIPKTEKKGE